MILAEGDRIYVQFEDGEEYMEKVVSVNTDTNFSQVFSDNEGLTEIPCTTMEEYVAMIRNNDPEAKIVYNGQKI